MSVCVLALSRSVRQVEKDVFLRRIWLDDNADIEQTADSVLWNSMVYPLLNMTIYGVIWYQGQMIAVTVGCCWFIFEVAVDEVCCAVSERVGYRACHFNQNSRHNEYSGCTLYDAVHFC